MAGNGLFSTLAADDATYMASSAENAARAEAAANASEASADEAAASANSAATSLTQIGNALTQAQASASASATSASASAAASATASTYKDAAEAAATRAEAADTDMQVQINQAKAWASQATGTVDGTLYSSRYYSTQSSNFATASANSATASAASAAQSASTIQLAKDWANKDGIVAAGEYSAKYYANQSKISATTAQSWSTTSSNAASNALIWSNNAQNSATSAATSASTAQSSITSASQQADRAKTEADRSAAQVSLAAAQVTLASNQVDLAAGQVSVASRWADLTTGPVTGSGSSARYSAKYWADKAADFAGGGYVLKIGDTMSGNLTISKATPTLTLTDTTSTQSGSVSFDGTNGLQIVGGGSTVTLGGSLDHRTSSSKFSIASDVNTDTTYADMYFRTYVSPNSTSVRASAVLRGTGNFELFGGDFIAPIYGGQTLKQYIDAKTTVTPEVLSNYVLKTTTVNGKALTGNIALTAADVSAVPTTRTVNGLSLANNINLSYLNVQAVSDQATVNGKLLTSNPVLTSSDIGAVPSTRTVNGKPLSDNITLTAADLNALTNRADTIRMYSTSSTAYPVLRLDGTTSGDNTRGNVIWTGSYASNGLVTSSFSTVSTSGSVQATMSFSQAGVTIPGDITSPVYGGTIKNYVDTAIGNISTAGLVPTSRTINGKALTADVTLTQADIAGAASINNTINGISIGSNPVLTTDMLNAVPTSRTINGIALTSNVTLSAANVGAVPTTRTINNKSLASNVTLTASDIAGVMSTTGSTMTGSLLFSGTGVGVSWSTAIMSQDSAGINLSVNPLSGSTQWIWKYSRSGLTTIPGDITSPTFGGSLKDYIDTNGVDPSQFVPATRTVNGKALSSNISITTADIGAVPIARTVNGKALTSDITLTAEDVGAMAQPTTVGLAVSLTGGATQQGGYNPQLYINTALGIAELNILFNNTSTAAMSNAIITTLSTTYLPLAMKNGNLPSFKGEIISQAGTVNGNWALLSTGQITVNVPASTNYNMITARWFYKQ